MTPRHRDLLVAATCIAALAGCGGPTNAEKLGIAEVTGRVTLDGQPLPGAEIRFYDEKTAHASIGKTDADGRYRQMFFGQVPGVAPGPKTVRITTGKRGDGDGDDGPQVERVPKRYNTSSELKVDVKHGEPQTFDFDLESSGDIAQPESEAGEKT